MALALLLFCQGCAQEGRSGICLCQSTPRQHPLENLIVRDDPFGASALGDRMYAAYHRVVDPWQVYTLADCYMDLQD